MPGEATTPSTTVTWPELLDQALFHVEHLRLGLRDAPAATRG